MDGHAYHTGVELIRAAVGVLGALLVASALLGLRG
jgi:hypothetical protein